MFQFCFINETLQKHNKKARSVQQAWRGLGADRILTAEGVDTTGAVTEPEKAVLRIWPARQLDLKSGQSSR
jgi:hypothetical protein